jgi:A118 family predicted phage portal protein
MPLPSDDTIQWPPAEMAKEYAKFNEWAAWYSGDPARLREFYAGFSADGQPLQIGSNGRPWFRFWSRASQDVNPSSQRATLHVPVAGDLASMSGALLFGEEPKIRIAEAHDSKSVDASAKASEDRLQEILEEGGAYNRLIEAAETCAALGGVFLRPVWDEEVAPYPLIAVTQTDMAIPTFKWGVLTAVTFWRVLEENGNVVTRHLERHEKVSGSNAVILHAVYQGNRTQLGVRLSDDTLAAMTGLEPVVELPFEDLDVQYVPNMRPNRLWRSSPLGLSDYSGSETILDSIDEVYASWMRDIRLAKARIVVPREYLDEGGNFDLDHEIYTPVDMEPGATESGARAMLAHQFNIRYEEHLATVLELVERTVSNAGYSPQSFGLRIEGRAESGTALRIRENKTFLTQKRKSLWWGPALSTLAEHLLLIDIYIFGSAVEPFRPTAELSDSITNDPVEMAQTVNTLKSAQAASTLTRVKLAQPDLTDDEAQAEADKIIEEEGIGAVAPDPFAIGGGGTPPAEGGGDTRPAPGDDAETEEGESDASS